MPADFPRPQTNSRVLRFFALLCAQGLATRSESVAAMMRHEPDPNGAVRAKLVRLLAGQIFALDTARATARADVYAAVMRQARKRAHGDVLFATADQYDPKRLLRADERLRIVEQITAKLLNEWGVRK